MFQFTHPGKGATYFAPEDFFQKGFQFTHPGKGATFVGEFLGVEGGEFQFTHPGKGATVWCKGAYYRADKQA